MTNNFTKKAVSGVKWSAVSQFGTQGVVMVGSIVLARLLSPGDFGLMALITVLSGFANYFANFGFGTAIIQKAKITNTDLSSVFWLNLLMGVVLSLVFFLGASFIADFFKEPLLRPLTMAVSMNFLLSSCTIIHYALLNRNLAFKEIAIATFSAVFISYSSAILLAFFGFGVWSLISQTLLHTLVSSVLYFYFSRWRPQFLLDLNSIKSLGKVGFHVFFISMLDYIAINIDTILIGKFINKKQLGEYGRANAFLMLPVVNVTAVISRVMMPSLAQLQHDKPRVAEIYFKAARLIAAITFPMMIGLAVVAHPFVLVVFGEKWVGMVPMLQFFSIMGILASLNSLHDPVIVSQGRTDLLFKLAPFEKGILISAVFGGLYWGVFGIIVCKVIASILIMVPKVWVLGNSVQTKVRYIYNNLIPFLIMALGMGAIVWFFDQTLATYLNVGFLLVAEVVLGIVTYGLLVYFFKPEVIKEARSFL